MDLPCCGCGRKPGNRHLQKGPTEAMASHNNLEAASPLAPGDKYPQKNQQGQQHLSNRQSYPQQYHHNNRKSQNSLGEEDEDFNPNTTVIMTGNGFFVTSSSGPGHNGNGGSGSGLMKSKSGSMPDRYSTRGFRDTFVSSMSPPAGSFGSHSHSATSSPHHQMMSPNNRNDVMNSPHKESNIGKESGSGSSKKWTFGGLFKRKSKNLSNGHSQSPNLIGGGNSMGGTSSPISTGSMSMSLSSPSPAPSSSVNPGSVSTQPYPRMDSNPHGATVAKGMGNNNSNNIISTTPANSGSGGGNKYVSTPTQTRHRGKLSESDLSSEDSEAENDSWAQQNQQPVSFKQNFLTRRLSRRREKAAAKKKAIDDQKQLQSNGLLKVPGGSGQLNNGKRVGSSPESLNNNGNNIFGFGTNGPWPSWEITKKVPQLQAANNYSSSGSLSLSLEGSTKGSRAALKEAVKARAVARRESFFHDSSSEDDGEDRSRSSIQGSHSSLSSRNRRRPYVTTNGASGSGGGGGSSYPYPPQQGQTFRPSEFARGSPSSPARFDYQNNNPSPNFNRKPIAPGSPRWEARVVYQQENVENDTPFVVKLPKNKPNLNNGNQGQGQLQKGTPGYIVTTEPTSEDQHVITAGLRVPISGQLQNGQYITEEVHYANLPNGANQNMMRQRSATPQNYPSGYNSVNPSPPPPPPRRDFSRQTILNNQQSNPNFYRPVSCSYLDSYQGFYNQRNNASPNLNGNSSVMSFKPVNLTPTSNVKEYYENQTQSQLAGTNNGNYYYDQDQVDNVGQNAGNNNSNNNNFLAPSPYQKQLNLIRSPSEPPEIKVQYARESPVKRNAVTPSPYNKSQECSILNPSPSSQQPVITSKLGFPVRRLQEASKIPSAQSPVHMRASEFWRKKEAEVTGNPVQPNPNHIRYMNRIRSADSSPLPIHRMRNSPVIQNSNESISSLSSFSAEAASPHMFNNNVRALPGQRMGRLTPSGHNSGNSLGQNSRGNNSEQNASQNPRNNSPNNGGGSNPGQNNSGGNNSGQSSGGGGDHPGNNGRNNSGHNPGFPAKSTREKTQSQSQQSACERLKVRTPSAPSTTSDAKEEPHKIRSLVELNNGKTPGRNLEDALNELEDMYKSLRLSDEDLLDRAERRDLPTPHQELRNAPLIPLPQSYQQQKQAFRFEPLGSVESLATGSSSGSGTNYSGDNPNRVRAPPLRRSSRPDTVTDDMARRRIDTRETKPLDPRNVIAQTGSYMVLSPAFSPPVSPCPPETLPLSIIPFGHDEPDLTLDDVTFRNYRKANSIRIIDPQPPFGIPLGPITDAPGTDYLHSKRSDRLRPLFKPTKNPDLVNDDIAFRNLRKDLNSESNLSKDWTPRLFSPTRDNNVFTYNVEPEQRHKKLRAIRSLSANITNFIPFTEYSFNSADNIGKWNSFTDLHQRNSNNSPFSQPQPQEKRRASTYLQPSWVEQIEKVQTSTETLTENRNSNNKFASEPEHWERKLPSKTVQLTPAIYDPTKPRRPWTDIILESFEKEKQNEIEQIAAAANATANSNSTTNDDTNDSTTTTKRTTEPRSHPANNLEVTEEDDDVFLDARDESKSTSPEDRTHNAPNKSSTPTTSSSYARPEVDMITASVIDNKSHSGTGTQQEAFPLLAGQNTRRGSWVEPSRSSSSYLSSCTESNLNVAEDDRRRKSWSDFPKELSSPSSRSAPGSTSEFPLATSASSPTVKKLFTPLPPPRKIKQINLEAFSPSTKKKPINEVNCLKEVEGEKFPTTTDADFKNVQIPTSPNRGEEELNELMDMLIREADTCGTASNTATTSTTTDNATTSTKSTVDHIEGEGKIVGNKCSSSSEQVKPSISSSSSPSPRMTQKDRLDSGNTLQTTTTATASIASLPKIPSKESQVDEPTTRRKEKKILRWDEQENIVVAVVPEEVDSVTRKPTRQLEDLVKTEKIVKDDDDNKPTVTTTTVTTTTNTKAIETKSKSSSDPCSIEELIDSINESLPELEASYSSSHKSNENESSLSSMGSLPSVPSPQPGSLTRMITLPVRESPQENLSREGDFLHRKSEVDDQDQHQHQHQHQYEPALQQEMEAPVPLDEGKVTRTEDHRKCEEKADQPGQSGLTRSSTSNLGESHQGESVSTSSRRSSTSSGSNNKANDNDTPTTSPKAGSSGGMMVKKSPEVIGERRKTNERSLQKDDVSSKKGSDYSKESSPAYGFKGHLPFLRNSTARSRSHSLIGSVSTSPTTGSEMGESKREKDKSHKRKSHLNRAFTEEPVPDSTSSFHLSSHTINREAKSNELSSSDCTSAEPLSRKSSIYKVPTIPSILTTNNNNDQSDESPVRKTPVDNTISSSQLPPSPTMKLKSSNMLGKMQTYESRKSSPVVKKDSFSDAEGVSFIKKLLQKESMAEKTANTTVTDLMKQSSLPRPISKESGFSLKKSPSAGSSSYWSKFSNSQPAFLKKFFEKPEKSAKELPEPEIESLTQPQVTTTTPTPIPGGPEEEPVLGFSVAEKASFFMKLEHEQRFSKWRKNSLEGPSLTGPIQQHQVNSATPALTKSRSSRQLTQPVTTTEVQLAANTISGESKTNSTSAAISIPSKILQSPAQPLEYEDALLFDNEDSDEIQAGANLSSYIDCDESRPEQTGLEPSKLSLKDRVHMFDKIIATGTKAPSAAPTPYPSTGGRETAPMSGFPVYHSSSAVISSSSKISAPPPMNFYATNQITYNTNFPISNSNTQVDTSSLNPENGFFRRRGSASDVELSTTPKYSPVISRNSKTRSMFVADDVSEDGEVSSGGQEVAEIISRSYENSPLVRKKSWRTQKQAQASFTKEIWRRCKVNDNWNGSQDNARKPQPSYKVTSKVTHQVANTQILYHQPQEPPPLVHPQQPTSSASPPTTSNLLQILTVLSSSNDELNETKPKQNAKKVGTSLGNSSTGSSVSIAENVNNITVANQVNVPHPDDESFQTFFGSRSSAFTHSDSTSISSNAAYHSSNHPGLISASSDIQSAESLDMNAVQRESELLVMRKNIPLVRRKSSGKSRNPLKALAARMDFRNQWYTDVTDATKEVSSNEDELF